MPVALRNNKFSKIDGSLATFVGPKTLPSDPRCDRTPAFVLPGPLRPRHPLDAPALADLDAISNAQPKPTARPKAKAKPVVLIAAPPDDAPTTIDWGCRARQAGSTNVDRDMSRTPCIIL